MYKLSIVTVVFCVYCLVSLTGSHISNCTRTDVFHDGHIKGVCICFQLRVCVVLFNDASLRHMLERIHEV